MSEALLATEWPVPADDPYPVLAQLRHEDPVHYIEAMDCHLVVAHRDALAVLSSSSWSSDPRTNEAIALRLDTSSIGDLLSKAVLFSDPPEHQRLRRSLGGHLSPRAAETMRLRIRSVVDAACTDLADQDSFDVMQSFAYPVPLAVICEFLDVGADEARVIRNETSKMAAMLDPLAAAIEVEEGVGAAFGVMLQLVPLVAHRRTRPGDDLLSALVSSSGGRPGLEADEAILMGLLLLAAGHETTANLIANAALCLHQHPHLARELRRNPALLAPAVEELTRYESPVQLTSRVAKHYVRLGEVGFEAGAQVLVSIGGANRDPAAFEEPDALDFSRAGRGHLSFGHGAHFCAGASLARVEVQEVLTRLIALDPPLEDREVTAHRGGSHTFRRFDSLLVRSR